MPFAEPGATEQWSDSPALAGALDVVELLASLDRALGLAEISDLLKRPQSELSHMVKELAERGYIAGYGGSDRYRLTSRFLSLHQSLQKSRALVEVALPEMRRLAASIGQSNHLAVPTDDDVFIMARVEGGGPLCFSARVGHTLQFVNSVSGIVLFAHQPADVQARWLAASDQSGTVYDRAAFFGAVEEARLKRIYIRRSRVTAGVIDISTPVLRKGTATAALTVPFLTRLDAKEPAALPVDELKEAAARISAALSG